MKPAEEERIPQSLDDALEQLSFCRDQCRALKEEVKALKAQRLAYLNALAGLHREIQIKEQNTQTVEGVKAFLRRSYSSPDQQQHQDMLRKGNVIEAFQVADSVAEELDLEGRSAASRLDKTCKWRRTGTLKLSSDYRDLF